MPATVTLSSSTLAAVVQADDDRVKLASTTGLRAGMALYVQDAPGRGEQMTVLSVADPFVKVLRGVGATKSSAHSPSLTVWFANGDQLYVQDPSGEPPDAIPVSPYINTKTGDLWYSQGDALPLIGTSALTQRWWQKATTTFDQGPLGVRTTTQTPTSST